MVELPRVGSLLGTSYVIDSTGPVPSLELEVAEALMRNFILDAHGRERCSRILRSECFVFGVPRELRLTLIPLRRMAERGYARVRGTTVEVYWYPYSYGGRPPIYKLDNCYTAAYFLETTLGPANPEAYPYCAAVRTLMRFDLPFDYAPLLEAVRAVALKGRPSRRARKWLRVVEALGLGVYDYMVKMGRLTPEAAARAKKILHFWLIRRGPPPPGKDPLEWLIRKRL